MKQTRLLIITLAITLTSLASGYMYQQRQQGNDTMPKVSGWKENFAQTITGSQRPVFTLPDLNGEPRDISEWDGQVVTLNFWATWCPPCLKEIPELIALQSEYGERGLQVIGIALQRAEELPEFVREQGINYPVLAGEAPVIRIAEAYGNSIGALPYTAVFDRTGKIVFIKPGPVTGPEIAEVIADLL